MLGNFASLYVQCRIGHSQLHRIVLRLRLMNLKVASLAGIESGDEVCIADIFQIMFIVK